MTQRKSMGKGTKKTIVFFFIFVCFYICLEFISGMILGCYLNWWHLLFNDEGQTLSVVMNSEK
jgi:hypothetical protein